MGRMRNSWVAGGGVSGEKRYRAGKFLPCKGNPKMEKIEYSPRRKKFVKDLPNVEHPTGKRGGGGG